MSETVVDALEMVQVQKQQGAASPVPLAARQFDLELLLKMLPVRKTGKKVVSRTIMQYRFQALGVGNVDHVARPDRKRAVPSPIPAGRQAKPLLLAVGSDDSKFHEKRCTATIGLQVSPAEFVAIIGVNQFDESAHVGHEFFWPNAQQLHRIGAAIQAASDPVFVDDVVVQQRRNRFGET